MSAAVATATCAVCQGPITGASVTKTRRGQECQLHVACWETVLREKAEHDRRQLDVAHAALRRTFQYCAKATELEQHVGGFPEFPFARFDNEEFLRRTSKRIAVALGRTSFEMSLLVSAPSGRGKTSVVVARLHQLLDDAVATAKPAEPGYFPHGFAPRFFFLTGPELAGARRNWKLGEESPIVAKAKNAELLILDEIGFEPLTETPFEVIDHRYRAQLVTVVTTGLKPVEFRTRYGDALYRRLTESGAVIEDW